MTQKQYRAGVFLVGCAFAIAALWLLDVRAGIGAIGALLIAMAVAMDDK